MAIIMSLVVFALWRRGECSSSRSFREYVRGHAGPRLSPIQGSLGAPDLDLEFEIIIHLALGQS